MAIAALLGLGLSLAGSLGVGDKDITETEIDYSAFGNFDSAGLTPGEAAGAIETTKDVTTKHTGVSETLSIAGAAMSSVGGILDAATSIKNNGLGAGGAGAGGGGNTVDSTPAGQAGTGGSNNIVKKRRPIKTSSNSVQANPNSIMGNLMGDSDNF